MHYSISSAATVAPAEATLTAATKLEPLLPILDGFNYRHRNQHSASHWWSAFNLLRHGTRSLAANLERHHTLIQQQQQQQQQQTDKKKTSTATKAKFKAAQKHLVARVNLLRHHTIPKAYLCFSQLVADNQHAALGLLLLGVLASVYSVLAVIAPSCEHITARDDCPPSNLKQPTGISSVDGFSLTPNKRHEAKVDSVVDRGIAVPRSGFSGPTIEHKEPLPSSSLSSTSKLKTDSNHPQRRRLATVTSKLEDKLKKKKSRKKDEGDEFSSLFASL